MTEERKDFIIKDKRFFAQENEENKDQKDKADTKRPKEEEIKAKASENGGPSPKAEAEPRLPKINFPTFIFSLNSSCLVQLGLLEDPASGVKTKNLALAKQTIDILGMLEEKTRGNLTKDEENMLKNILYDLRIIYVKEKG